MTQQLVMPAPYILRPDRTRSTFDRYAGLIGQTVRDYTPRVFTHGDIDAPALYFGADVPVNTTPALAAAWGYQPKSGDPFSCVPIWRPHMFQKVFAAGTETSRRSNANRAYGEGYESKDLFVGDAVYTQTTYLGAEINPKDEEFGIVTVHQQAFDEAGGEVVSYKRKVNVPFADTRAKAEALHHAPDPFAKIDYGRLAACVGNLPTPDFKRAGITLETRGLFEDFNAGDAWLIGGGRQIVGDQAYTNMVGNFAETHFNTDFRKDGKVLVVGGFILNMGFAAATRERGVLDVHAPMIGFDAGQHLAPSFPGEMRYAGARVAETRDVGNENFGVVKIEYLVFGRKLDAVPQRGDDKKFPDGDNVVAAFSAFIAVPKRRAVYDQLLSAHP